MKEKMRRSMRFSLLDGIFANVMTGMSETFIVPYALALKASTGTIGILSGLPNLAGALMQIKSPSVAERMGSRMGIIKPAVLVHALMWIPIILIPYLVRNGAAIWVIALYTMLIASNSIAIPPWSSMVSDHVPETERGKVFGFRNRVFGIVNVSCMLTAGYILSFFKERSYAIAGFTVIFSIAFIARIFSWYFLTRMYDPPLTITDEDRFTMTNFIKRIRRSNFGRFVIFVSMINFATNISAPFFAVYMIRDLGFSYLTYTIITMSATLTSLVMMNEWGKAADKVGNRKVLRFTSLFIPAVPVLWLFSNNVAYLIAIQVVAGFFWAGFNLSASNFIYDATSPAKRTRCVAYFNVINGLSMFSGAALGGFLIKYVPPVLGYNILTIFLLSGILRVCASFMCTFVKEVRKVEHVSHIDLIYSMIGRE